jgi:hypothetical protein
VTCFQGCQLGRDRKEVRGQELHDESEDHFVQLAY